MNSNLFMYKGNLEFEKQMQEICEIYEHIQDDISKKIFVNRILLSMTDDITYLRKLVLLTKEGQNFYQFLQNYSGHIFLYGAGIRGMRMLEMYGEIDFKGFIDCEKKGRIKGIKIYHPSEVSVDESDIILVTNYKDVDEIVESICNTIKIKKEAIYTVERFNKKLINDQYFEKRVRECWGQANGGIFVDAGCFDGADTIKYWSRINSDASVVAFEPDDGNYQRCQKELALYQNVEFKQVGLGDKKKHMRFVAGEGEKSYVSEEGNTVLQIDTIDNLIPSDMKIDMIKMDIEGSEYDALVGASQHIRNDLPKLAISVYHKKEDIFTIPNLLLKLNPDYKFMFGHYYVLSASDTVLYAYV